MTCPSKNSMMLGVNVVGWSSLKQHRHDFFGTALMMTACNMIGSWPMMLVGYRDFFSNSAQSFSTQHWIWSEPAGFHGLIVADRVRHTHTVFLTDASGENGMQIQSCSFCAFEVDYHGKHYGVISHASHY